MPKRRQPREIWLKTRERVWNRDKGLCQFPGGKHPVTLAECHIDHIQSGVLGTNDMANLRTLCFMHHALRANHRHQGLIGKALDMGLLPADWRKLVWDD